MPKVVLDLVQYLKRFLVNYYIYLFCLFSFILGFQLCYFSLGLVNSPSPKIETPKGISSSTEKYKAISTIIPTPYVNLKIVSKASIINFLPNTLYVGRLEIQHPNYSESRGINIVYKNSRNKIGKIWTSNSEEIEESDFKELLYSTPVKNTDNYNYYIVEQNYVMGESTNEGQILYKLNKEKAEVVFEHKYNYVNTVNDCTDNLKDNRFYVTKVIANKYIVINYICAVGTEPANLKESNIPQYLLNSETKKTQSLKTPIGNIIIDSKNKKIYGNAFIKVPNYNIDCFIVTGVNEMWCPEKIWEPDGELIKYDLEI